MKNNLSSTRKTHDIATGFFGWAILFNFYFVILFVTGGWTLIEEAGHLILGLPTIVTPLIFFMKNKWISVGILSAILIRMSIWTLMFLNHDRLPNDLFWALLIPFPLGFILAIY